MTQGEGESWLAELVARAQEEHWHIHGCSTCGGLDFLTALFWELAERSGLSRATEDPADTEAACRRIRALSDDQKRSLAETLVDGLRDLPHELVEMHVFVIIKQELARHWEELYDQSLASALSGSPAGQRMAADEAAQRRRALYSPVVESYDERHEADKRAARARRAARRQAGLERQAAMRAVQSEKNQRRRDLLAELESLDGAARLKWITRQPKDLPLDMIPAALIHGAVESGDVPAAVAADLLLRIGGRRGGWGRIRNLL